MGPLYRQCSRDMEEVWGPLYRQCSRDMEGVWVHSTGIVVGIWRG